MSAADYCRECGRVLGKFHAPTCSEAGRTVTVATIDRQLRELHARRERQQEKGGA